MTQPIVLERCPVHLGLGATVVTEPELAGGMAWYEAYAARHASDGAEGRLVTLYTFLAPWTSWERHPRGEELVVCLAGELTLHQELPEGVVTVTLRPHMAVVNPRGVWHTADVRDAATALFITAGEATEHRPREIRVHARGREG